MDFALFKRNLAVTLILYAALLTLTTRRRYDKKTYGFNTVGAYALCFFLSAVTIATGMTPLSGFHPWPDLASINWNPILGIQSVAQEDALYAALNLVGNFVLFAPAGFLLPLLCRKNQSFWKVTLIGFGLSFCIEFWQLFLSRGTDTADLLLNTVGCAFGYLVFCLFRALFSKFSARFSSTAKLAQQQELLRIVLAVLLPAVVTVGLGFWDRYCYFAR